MEPSPEEWTQEMMSHLWDLLRGGGVQHVLISEHLRLTVKLQGVESA